MTGVRRDDRLPFAADLDVIVAGRAGGARGHDVSVHGASFTCEFKLARGDALQIDLSAFGLGIRGAVVRHARVQRDRFTVGVEFFGALSSEEITLLANS